MGKGRRPRLQDLVGDESRSVSVGIHGTNDGPSDMGDSVLATPDHIKKVFEDSDKHAKAKNNNSGWLMRYLSQRIND